MTTRRDLLNRATLAAAATATGAFAAPFPETSVPEQSEPKGLTKIGLEEHFLVPEFIDYFAETYQNISPQIAKFGLEALQKLGERRIAIMDGIDFQVLSIAGPGVQVERDQGVALKRANAANDFLTREIQKRPTRFGGFAHLPMQNPAKAADELERCIRDLGFHGAM